MFDFRGKNVLVAGGTGLIGIQLVELLLAEGAKVRIASLDDPSLAHPEAEFLRLDLLEPQNCLRACAGMDYVFNLLCVKASPSAAAAYPARFFEANLLLDVLVLRAAIQSGVKGYLLASTVGVYPPGREVFREEDAGEMPPLAHDSGGVAKLFAERHIHYCRKQYGKETIISIVRLCNVYGPFDDFWSEAAAVIPSLIRKVAEGINPLPVFGDGSQVRDFMFSRDAAAGMLSVAKSGVEDPVNLGSGKGITIRELVSAILENAENKPEILWDTSKPAGNPRRVLDVNRARSLGFEPKIPLAVGIRETVSWYRKNRDKNAVRYNAFQAM